jgi:hypothetical protein
MCWSVDHLCPIAIAIATRIWEYGRIVWDLESDNSKLELGISDHVNGSHKQEITVQMPSVITHTKSASLCGYLQVVTRLR